MAAPLGSVETRARLWTGEAPVLALIGRVASVELRRMAAAGRALAFRPIVRPPEVAGERCFGSLESGQNQQLVVGFVLVLAIETPLVHLLLGAFLDPGLLRHVVRIGLLAASVYLALWLIGDLRLLRESAGVCVGSGQLRVDLGLRAQGAVALADVARVEDLRGRAEDAGAPAPGAARRPIRVTPLPDPNVAVELRRPVSLCGPLGLPVTGDRLRIYVDDPAGLVAALGGAARSAGLIPAPRA